MSLSRGCGGVGHARALFVSRTPRPPDIIEHHPLARKCVCTCESAFVYTMRVEHAIHRHKHNKHNARVRGAVSSEVYLLIIICAHEQLQCLCLTVKCLCSNNTSHWATMSEYMCAYQCNRLCFDGCNAVLACDALALLIVCPGLWIGSRLCR